MTRIVVIGGGFAGVTFMKSLHGKVDDDAKITLISEESYTTFNPMLAEVVGATVFPEHVVAPLRELTRSARFVMGYATSVDFAARRVSCHTLSGQKDIDYDYLVLAYGCRARLDLFPGIEEYGHVLKTVGDAMHLRNLVLRRLARIELETDAEILESLGHFVVIGGGFSGVETAGALADVLKSINHYYPYAPSSLLKVTLLQDGPHLLPQLPESLGLAAKASLMKRGVAVMVNTAAVEITKNYVLFKDGRRLPTNTVIATIGTKTNELTQNLPGVTVVQSRIACESDGRVKGQHQVWAIGDCAAMPTGENQYAPMTAQFAVAQGKYLAERIYAEMKNQTMSEFRYTPKGMMATVGHLNGVAEVYGVRLTGLPAWLLWRAYYLSQMPTLSRKVRIWVEWTWGMFFRPDITHFRFTRSQHVTEESLKQL